MIAEWILAQDCDCDGYFVDDKHELATRREQGSVR